MVAIFWEMREPIGALEKQCGGTWRITRILYWQEFLTFLNEIPKSFLNDKIFWGLLGPVLLLLPVLPASSHTCCSQPNSEIAKLALGDIAPTPVVVKIRQYNSGVPRSLHWGGETGAYQCGSLSF